LDNSCDVEKEEEAEEIVTRSPSVSARPSRAASQLSGSNELHVHEPERRVIRFDDGDPENPNNCMYDLCIASCEIWTNLI
jgi:hypothetical protein